MLSDRIAGALNEQIHDEMASAYLYLSMSAWCGDRNLPGFAHWMYMQYREELVHVDRLFNHVLERGGRVELRALSQPTVDWPSPVEVFNHAYQHECEITAGIHRLVTLTLEEHDHATHTMLQWFVTEQVEEEAAADGVRKQLALIDDSSAGLFMLDQSLAKRQPVAEEV
jgi:ferritin